MSKWILTLREPSREMVLKSRRAVKGPLPVQLMTDDDRHPADLKHRIRLRSALAASPDPAEDAELIEQVALRLANCDDRDEVWEPDRIEARAVIRLLSLDALEPRLKAVK